MNPNRKRRKWLGLLLAAMMLLSGCKEERTIQTESPEELQIEMQQAALNEADLLSPGYYAPNAVMDAQAPVVPAPATLEEIRRKAQEAAINNANYQAASPYTTIERGDINVGLVISNNDSINPLRCTSVDILNINTLVYEGLVALDNTHMPVPHLADRWEVSKDTWTFTLRSNVRFHDGSELTAEDVVASYGELKRNKGNYWSAMLSEAIDSMQAVDPSTLRVKSKCGYMMLYAMTFPVVQRYTMDGEVPHGTGPFVVAQYDINNAIRLVPYADWWRRSSEQVQSVVGLFYRTPKLAIAAMEQNEIDTLASEYPTASINRSLGDRMTLDYATQTYECIVPNLRKSILRDRRTREALMYAIDRSTLAETIYTGMVIESEVPVLPGSFLYEDQAARYSYNPGRALQILYDAGWKDNDGDGVLENMVDGESVRLRLKLMTYNRGTTTTRSEAIAAIQSQLSLIGCQVEIKTVSAGTVHSEMLAGDFDLALVAFELSDIQNLAFMLASNGNSNYMRYKSGAMDGLLRTAYDAKGAEAFKTAMGKVQMQIVEELPILGLFFRAGVLSSRTSVRGLGSGLRRGYVLSGITDYVVN